MSKKERELYAKTFYDYLCPKCEEKTIPQIMIEHRELIPMLVYSTCKKCGHKGNLIEIPKNKRR